MMAFGLLGAIVVGTATPSDARAYHGKLTHFRSVDRSAYAYYRTRYVWVRAYARWGYGVRLRNYPNRYARPFLNWDRYAKRWDGGD